MAGSQSFVVLLGGGLLAANIFLDPTFKDARTSVSSGSFNKSDVTSTPVKMAGVGLLTLFGLSALAGISDDVGKAIVIALVGLWILWLISYQTNKGGTSGTAKKT